MKRNSLPTPQLDYKKKSCISKAKIPLELSSGIFAILLVVLSHVFFVTSPRKANQVFSPPHELSHLTFGYQEVIADTLWIRIIQDLGFCDQPLSKNVCKNQSWLYRMIDAATDVSPHFRKPYELGGLALTVIISDIGGATKIFDKGVRQFPNDWRLLFFAGYQYAIEVKDKLKAAELLSRSAKNGAPPWVFSLAGKLYSETGNIALAEKVLEDMKASHQNKEMIEKLEAKIASAKQNSVSH